MKNNNAQGVVNLNEIKRKIYDGFNTFGHKDAPTTNPIEQREIFLAVQKATPGLTLPTQTVLLKIIEETVWREAIEEIKFTNSEWDELVKKLSNMGDIFEPRNGFFSRLK